MAVQVTYPGVYIEEFAPGAPIQGVGTSTAAFIGPAARGELDTPTKITSWDQFRATFGDQPLPGFFLWYAVRGFFENGGQVCYIVRASNGAYAGLGYGDPLGPPLVNRNGAPLLRVRARQPGIPSPVIQVEIAAAHLVPQGTNLYQPSGGYTVIAPREIILPSEQAPDPGLAAQFRPGDWVNLGPGNERMQVLRVSGAQLRLGSDYTGAINSSGTVRLADAPMGTRTVRIQPTASLPPGALLPGTMLTITQGQLSDSQIVETVQTELLATSPNPITTYRVTFRQGLDFAIDMSAQATVLSEEFDFVVTQGTAKTTYGGLSIDPAHPRYFLDVVNSGVGLVRLELIEPPPPAEAPGNLPDDTNGPVDLVGGENELLAELGDEDYIDALETLVEIDDVNLVAIPDCVTLQTSAHEPDVQQIAAVQQAVITHCELMADRFAVLDAIPGVPLYGDGSIEVQRLGLDSVRGYAALYYPWLRVRPFGPGRPILVPPTGHICGIIARSDNTHGVHKAPANEIVNGALGVERTMSDVEQGQLNLQGINVIRIFQTGGRPMLWGARTTATDLNWQYVNIRRLFLYIEESIEEGIRWAVFEPNNLQLWQKLKRTITEFLTRVWRDGGLFGATAEEAFYVRIDEVLNPFSEQALGRLNIEIGLRPTYPAEFIIVRIGIWQGDSEISEG